MLIRSFRKNKNKSDEMLFLRGAGWSYTALAEYYGCDKLTIRFIARKNGLTQDVVITQYTHQDYLSATTEAPKQVTITNTEERISEGKTYSEYLQEEKDRKWKRLIHGKNN